MSTVLAVLFGIGLVGVGVLYIFEKLQSQKDAKLRTLQSQKAIQQLTSERDHLRKSEIELSGKLKELIKYQGISDIDGRLLALRREVDERKAGAEQEVATMLLRGQVQAQEQALRLKTINTEIRKKSKEAEEGQSALLRLPPILDHGATNLR